MVGMDNPLFTIVIPAYNAEALLEETLRSVLAQSYDDWECLVINDGSTDATEVIARSYASSDPRIRMYSQKNAGIASAYNAGIVQARGEWIVMLSADDLLESEHLATMAEAIVTDNEASLFSTNGFYLSQNGSRQKVYPSAPWFGRDECTLSDLFDRCFYATGITLRKSAVESVGGFESGLYAEDYCLFLALLAQGYRHRYLDAPLSVHRRSDSQRSAQGLEMRQADLASIERIADEVELTAEQREAYQTARAKLLKNIGRRKRLHRILGASNAERLIGAMRRG